MLVAILIGIVWSVFMWLITDASFATCLVGGLVFFILNTLKHLYDKLEKK